MRLATASFVYVLVATITMITIEIRLIMMLMSVLSTGSLQRVAFGWIAKSNPADSMSPVALRPALAQRFAVLVLSFPRLLYRRP